MKLRIPWWGWLGLLVIAGLGTWAVFLRPPPAPETLVQQQLVEMARNAELKKVGPIVEHISEKFRGNDGIGKPELRGILVSQILRGQWVRVFVTEIDPHLVSRDKVEVRARFVFGRSDAKELKDLAKDSVLSAYEVTATSEHESDGEWRFVEATYRQLDPASLW